MKTLTLSLSCLVGLATAGTIAPRQLTGLLASLGEGNDGSRPAPGTMGSYVAKGLDAAIKQLINRAPELPLVSRTQMEPQIQKDAKRYKLRYGPLTVDPGNAPKGWTILPSLDPNGQSFVRLFQPRTICKDDCTVLGGRIYVETVDGGKSDRGAGVYDHHTLTFDLDKAGYNPVSLCDYDTVDKGKLSSFRSMSSGFIGSSEDNSETPTLYTSVDGSIKSGYHLKKDNKIALQADFVNYSNETQNVFIAYEIESLPGLQGWDAATTLVSVTGCKFVPPAVSKTERSVQSSKSFPILVDGAVLGAKGHMHNGGEKMVLMVNNKTVCESKVEYNSENRISGMSHCSVDYPVKRGDLMSIQSVYDVTKHPLRPSADGAHDSAHSSMGGEDLMAMWGLTFAVDNKAMRQ